MYINLHSIISISNFQKSLQEVYVGMNYKTITGQLRASLTPSFSQYSHMNGDSVASAATCFVESFIQFGD